MKSELILYYKNLIVNLIQCDNKGNRERQQIVEKLQVIKFMGQQCALGVKGLHSLVKSLGKTDFKYLSQEFDNIGLDLVRQK